MTSIRLCPVGFGARRTVTLVLGLLSACSGLAVLATKAVVPGEASADSDESALDTATIQAAIDNCPAGQSMRLGADTPAFLSTEE
jgi:polygalacturonase